MKIMAICGSGLGSSFMVEMNIKKVLKKLNIDAEVEHSESLIGHDRGRQSFCNGQRYCGQRQRTGKPTGGDQ